MAIDHRHQPSSRPLRHRGAHGHAKVTNIELFFDLVFVFAITQLSHSLLEHLNLQGVLQTGLLFLAVWWVWICTSWCTNWLDPDRASVRLMLFTLMLAGLLMSCALPHAFADEALLFAACYVAMQVGRSLFTLWALGSAQPALTRNFQRVAIWLGVSAIFWICGALAAPEWRMPLWALAIAIEYGSAWAGFWVPGLGRSHTSDWTIEGAHLAERCALFIMIALGESILVTGATAASVPATGPTVTAFGVAFIGSVSMWWIYFNAGVERGAEQIASAADPGRLGRLVYTYIHLLIVAGIIVGAVADELVLSHPLGHLDAHVMAPMVGGPALFLLANLWFKAVVWGRLPLSHMVGLALLALVTLVSSLATAASPLALASAVTAILLIVAAWETRSLRPSHHAALEVP